ncbi:CapA family protein [uncultured Brevibacillus sp.]|uniref:CapA family protein n=1 Tax=uncultured Brevibacillus sp. TaxID=169970 RepID=UPI00338F8652
MQTFAHRIFSVGADIIVGNGPYLLRGMEMCNRKPIFYSLGNLIVYNESVYKLPADS